MTMIGVGARGGARVGERSSIDRSRSGGGTCQSGDRVDAIARGSATVGVSVRRSQTRLRAQENEKVESRHGLEWKRMLDE